MPSVYPVLMAVCCFCTAFSLQAADDKTKALDLLVDTIFKEEALRIVRKHHTDKDKPVFKGRFVDGKWTLEATGVEPKVDWLGSEKLDILDDIRASPDRSIKLRYARFLLLRENAYIIRTFVDVDGKPLNQLVFEADRWGKMAKDLMGRYEMLDSAVRELEQAKE